MIIVSNLELDNALNSYFEFNKEVMRQLSKVNSYALNEGITDIYILGAARRSTLSYGANLLLNQTLIPDLNYHFVLCKQELGNEYVSTDLVQNLSKHKVFVHPHVVKKGKYLFEEGKVFYGKKKQPVDVPALTATKFNSKDTLGFVDATGKPKRVPLKSDIALVEMRTSQLRKPKKNEVVHLIIDTKDDFSKYSTRTNIARVTREVQEVVTKEDGLELEYDIEAFIQAWLENNNHPLELLKLRQELIA